MGTMTGTLQATLTGRKVLDALAKGRQKAIAAAQAKAAMQMFVIRELAMADMLAGRSNRGRAGRIQRKLGGTLSERLVRKYLARLFRGADSSAYAAASESPPQRSTYENKSATQS
jgi:hypothetical protein